MMMIRQYALLSLAMVSALIAPRTSDACGGCFHGPTTVQVVTDHRMVLSLSRDRTILWDQFRYSGAAQEFSWILPVRNGPDVGVEIADNVFLTSMDDVAAPQVNPVPSPGRCRTSSGGCGASATSAPDSRSGPGVNIYGTSVLGPYMVARLGGSDPMELRNWLTSNGYTVPAATASVIDFYVAQRMDFVAVRLTPQAEVSQMRPFRVVMPGYVPTLPLRMIAAGVADKVGLVLTVISDARVEAMNFPNGEIRDTDLAYDYNSPTAPSEDFLAAFNRINRANSNRVWLTESANRVPRNDLENARSIRCSRGFGGDVPPECSAANPTPSQSDIDAAYAPFGASAYVTRMRADLGLISLDRDLQLASSDRPVRSRSYSYSRFDNDPCANPRTNFASCSTSGTSFQGHFYLGAFATLGMVCAARSHRRRAKKSLTA
jgi:hypothetical protein